MYINQQKKKLEVNYYRFFFWIKTKTWNVFSKKVTTYSKTQQFFWKLYISIIFVYYILVKFSLYFFNSDLGKIYGYGFLFRCLNTFNKFLSASEYMQKIRKLLKENIHLKKYLNEYLLNEISFYDPSKLIQIKRKNINDKNHNEEFFRSLTKNKSILIIGSAPQELNEEIKTKIENHDFILVFNPRNLTKVEKIIPKRKQIAFYRGEYSKYLKKSNLNNNIFCIFKVKKTKEIFENYVKSRMIIRPLNKDRMGQTNGVQDVIFDLLNWEFSLIEVICCDLLLTRGNSKGYRKKSEGLIFYPSTFYSHPPELQFSFLKKLKNSYPNRLTFDEKLENILKGGLISYLKEMETLSRNHKIPK